MCNRYAPPRPDEIIERWRPRQMNVNYPPGPMFPRSAGPFIRAARDRADAGRELAVGQWTLVPWFAKSHTLGYSTNNARFESIGSKASFKQPWLRAMAQTPGVNSLSDSGR
jgi:putative SOS response-associated peptidase YedK